MVRKRKFDFYVDSNGCFICTSHKRQGEKTHPMARHNSKSQLIARHIYEACFGEVPKGKLVRHKCDNYECINPEHLEVGTAKDNMVDMAERKRNFKATGSKNGRSKLTHEQVRQIKESKRLNTSKEVAQLFGVADRTIRDIWQGNIWKEVEEI